MIRPRPQRGFTLLELLVALAIFALLAVMAYGGLSKVLRTEDILDQQLDRLAEVQRTFTFLERDLLQLIPRDIRDQYGDTRPFLQGRDPLQGSGEPLLALTRSGYANPLGVARSELQRVDWRLKDEALYRETWPVLDRAQDSLPRAVRLCTRVQDLRLRFLDDKKKWHRQWPPEDQQAGGLQAPLAVEVTLELTDWGELRRLVPLGAVSL